LSIYTEEAGDLVGSVSDDFDRNGHTQERISSAWDIRRHTAIFYSNATAEKNIFWLYKNYFILVCRTNDREQLNR